MLTLLSAIDAGNLKPIGAAKSRARPLRNGLEPVYDSRRHADRQFTGLP